LISTHLPPPAYARRYALFTLVGIAGEDDLDAPDLPIVGSNNTSPHQVSPGSPARGPNGHGEFQNGRTAASQHKRVTAPATVTLSPEASAACRDQLVSEIDGAASTDDMALIAHRALPQKNTLRTEDSTIVEEVFAAKLKGLASGLAQSGGIGPANLVDPPSDRDSPSEQGRAPDKHQPLAGRLRAAPAKQMATTEPDRTAAPTIACAELAFGKTRRKPIRRTALLSPRSRAWSVAVSRPTLITCGSRNRGRWAASRATSSQYRFVESIIASFISAAMKRRGGRS
jgi:hypothetical protein